MIKLYDFGNSVCCQKVRITLCEKGLDWESVNVDLFRSEQYTRNTSSSIPRALFQLLFMMGNRSSNRL